MALQNIITDIHDDIEYLNDRINDLDNLGSYVGTQIYASVPTLLSDLIPGATVNDFFNVDVAGLVYRYIITSITGPNFTATQDILYSVDITDKVDIIKEDINTKTEILNNISNFVTKVTDMQDQANYSILTHDLNGINIESVQSTGSAQLLLDLSSQFRVYMKSSQFDLNPDSSTIYINDGIDTFKFMFQSNGLSGSLYIAPTIDESFVQKKYVDDSITAISGDATWIAL